MPPRSTPPSRFSLAGAAALLLLASGFTAMAASRGDSAGTAAPAASLYTSLRAAAPALDAEVLALALEARDCATQRGLASDARRLAVIDYTRPSTEPRLWVFDLERPGLLFSEHVAHGRGTGDNVARNFSNRDGSHQSSLGLFRTAETYMGGNGYSLRMDGLEPGINDRARERAIVMHGAWYVDPDLARRQGRLGRSYGCPAVRSAIARPLIDTLSGGQLVFAYYPQNDWLRQSRVLGCGRAAGAGPTRAAKSP